MIRLPKILLGIAALALAFVPGPAVAEGQLTCNDRFVTATSELDLCTFTNPRADGTEIRVLLLGIESSDHRRISITFVHSRQHSTSCDNHWPGRKYGFTNWSNPHRYM